MEGKTTYLILSIMVSVGWILLLLRKFMKKII
jgi:hypothetical protein